MISIEPCLLLENSRTPPPSANPNVTLTIVRLPCLLVDPSTSQQFQQNQYCLREAAKKIIFLMAGPLRPYGRKRIFFLPPIFGLK